MTTYERRFTLQAAHLNGESDYAKVREADAALRAGDGDEAALLLREVLFGGLHGHNFEVVIRAEGLVDASGYVVDDEALARLVTHFDNRNLSFMPEFAGRRATTEVFAEVLAILILQVFPALARVRVQVFERPEIMAAAEVSR